MAHGEWDDWCEKELGMSRRNANRFIRVYERFANGTPVAQLPNAVSILDALVPFSDEELTQPHAMSDGSTKTLPEMSRREIEELKRKLRLEQQAREMERAGAATLIRSLALFLAPW